MNWISIGQLNFGNLGYNGCWTAGARRHFPIMFDVFTKHMQLQMIQYTLWALDLNCRYSSSIEGSGQPLVSAHQSYLKEMIIKISYQLIYLEVVPSMVLLDSNDYICTSITIHDSYFLKLHVNSYGQQVNSEE